MKRIITLLFLLATGSSYGQISVDSTAGGVVMVTEKTPVGNKSLNVYTYLNGDFEKSHEVVFEPHPGNTSEDPDTLHLNFAAESVYLKDMLAAALKYKNDYNLAKFAMNILSYSDVMTKLIDLYTNSADWNNYLRKAPTLVVTTKLLDGNEFTELAYNSKVASRVLDKSDFLKGLNAIFNPHGYKVVSNGFADEHQQIVSEMQLKSLHRDEHLFIPVPVSNFKLVKIK